MKIINSLEDVGLLIKSVSGTIENDAKEQRAAFFGMYIRTSLLENILTTAGEGTISAG